MGRGERRAARGLRFAPAAASMPTLLAEIAPRRTRLTGQETI